MKNEIFSSWNELSKNIKSYLQLSKIEEAQNEVRQLVTNLQKDFNKIVDKDVAILKKRFLKEKKEIENLLNKTVSTEIKKAQKYVDSQKRELIRLQKKLEKYIKSEKTKAKKTLKKNSNKKSTKKKSAKKKTTQNKKTSKKKTTKKKVAKKKTTKKS